MKKYIAKIDTWFKAGTEAVLEEKFNEEIGLFRGTRVCQIPEAEAGRPVGSEYIKGEVCSFDEFEVIDE